MRAAFKNIITIVSICLACACSQEPQDVVEDFGDNPFLEPTGEKPDTGYVNIRGFEVEVTLEADIQADSYYLFKAPAELAQFAVTYLRNKDELFVELLAEDTAVPDRVEWLVDGQWLTKAQADSVDQAKLTHFRLKTVNAVVMESPPDSVTAGKVFQAKVPKAPLSIMRDAGNKCAEPDSHISLDQSVYWYLWNPERAECPAEFLQTMTLTVERVLPANPESYPEYDRLWEDQKLTVAVFFGRLDDGDIKQDYNWNTFNQFVSWLAQAKFTEEAQASMGKRFVKTKAERSIIVDVYGPDVFESVADYGNIQNWQKAVSEHEVVMYNGHSVLGTGYAFEEVRYPDFYQIFQVASCLSYEYYVRPVLAGKGGWENVDVISNLQPTYYSENLKLCGAFLAKLFEGFENSGQVSWQDILEAVSRKLYHATFGVSGARENCFSPEGNRCKPGPDPDPEDIKVENSTPIDVPDSAPDGVSSVIEVPENVVIAGLTVELDITHTYVGDLEVTLSHNDVTHKLWTRQGGSDDNIQSSFKIDSFKGVESGGQWTLRLKDLARQDTGKLNRWALVISKNTTPEPNPTGKTFENTTKVSIPDADSNGARSNIEVNEQFTIQSMKVEIDVTHSYVGDLSVGLVHNGTEVTLWDHEYSQSNGIQKIFEPAAFDGSEAQGTWELVLLDNAAQDLGELNSWKLYFAVGE